MVTGNENGNEFVRFCRIMLKQMTPHKKKFNICPSEITPQHIALLSPVIYYSSSLSKLSIIVTHDKITPQKK